MAESRYSSYLAFSFLLTLLLAGCLLIQAAGQWLDVPLATACLPLALLPFLGLTYGYVFPLTRQHLVVGIMLAALLALAGITSSHWFDMTSDGMGYHQPAAQAIWEGWNPLHHNATLLWQNIYPCGAWEIEASLASLFGTIEATKTLQSWWIIIAVPVLLSGVTYYKAASLTRAQVLLVMLMVFGPVVLGQVLTHYVDAMIYLAGVSFIGALLMVEQGGRLRLLACLIMGVSLLFIVNAKLSGIYHAVMLCAAAIIFLWLRRKHLPWRMAAYLFCTGLVATFFLGYHPYITNFLTYGSYMHMDAETFSSAQRPWNLTPMHGIVRFFYSLFSATGGSPLEPAQLKWPWTIGLLEWVEAGAPDSRTGGFGPLFALGLLTTFALMVFALLKQYSLDKRLLGLSFICLLFSVCFPQGWWARYVPFAYSVPFLLLLALPKDALKGLRFPVAIIIAIFFANSTLSAVAAYWMESDREVYFQYMLKDARSKPAGSVYLVAPAEDYDIYNHSYQLLQRRLSKAGVQTTIRINDSCPHKLAEWAEFKICY